MKRTARVLTDCLKKNRLALILFAVTALLNGAVFLLYGIMAEPFLYAEILLLVFLLAILSIDFLAEYRAAKRRERNIPSVLVSGTDGIPLSTLRDGDYAEMIERLTKEINRLTEQFSLKQQADGEYYAAWVHQIKTPIAVMKLRLAEDTEENRLLASELFRIEQYVEMALDYGSLESGADDLVIREYALDEIIRETLRKFAPQFILKQLKLTYEPTDRTVVTDKKWLSFILEQLISNAVKYTPEGEISVSVSRNTVRISDTGIGIAAEDLPRIFEKGYTGMNGRIGQQSSGLGLFLTKKAADLLSVKVYCKSTVGAGSTFSVELPEKETAR